jgi:formylglycine-generating enzyme required for sulfatase activity
MPDVVRPLRVFLCHSSGDKPIVRELYHKLHAEPWIQPWLDEEELYPGEDWDLAIQKAVEESDAVLVCLSNNSITKRGYVQKELRFVLDIALEMPEETIFIIPLRLEACDPPRSLREWQYADYFPESQRKRAFNRLLVSLQKRADSIGLKFDLNQEPSEKAKLAQIYYQAKPATQKEKQKPVIESVRSAQDVVESVTPSERNKGATMPHERNRLVIGGIEFVRVPKGNFVMGSKYDNTLAYESEKPQHTVEITYDYWMAKFILTNSQFAEFIKTTNHITTAEKEGGWHPKQNIFVKGVDWKHPTDSKDKWEDKQDHPVVQVSWDDAMQYCQWFSQTFKSELGDLLLRLPTEAEWEKAARGAYGNEWPWGNEFDKNKCNSSEGGKDGTTPVGLYSSVGGDSPYGCADMAGNVREWTHSLFEIYPYNAKDGRDDEEKQAPRVLRGGAFNDNDGNVRCAYRYGVLPYIRNYRIGFRVVVSPHL